jgi:hypothetical protein
MTTRRIFREIPQVVAAHPAATGVYAGAAWDYAQTGSFAIFKYPCISTPILALACARTR